MSGNQETGRIMRAARAEQGLTFRGFRDAIQRGLASHISLGKIQGWLEWDVKPQYEEMYYLATHAREVWVCEMAARVMRVLQPAAADADLGPELPGPVSIDTGKGEKDVEDTVTITC